MKVAVTYDGGQIFQHFGHTEAFKVYEIHEKKIVSDEIVPTEGSGHGALADFLKEHQVEILICGGIGAGAQNALAQAGITLYGGVSGDVDQAVQEWVNGTLKYNPEVSCSHHDHGEHENCGTHGCGNGTGHSCHGHE